MPVAGPLTMVYTSLTGQFAQCLTEFWPGTQSPQRMGIAGAVAQVSFQVSDLI